jgi:hypothetical protein
MVAERPVSGNAPLVTDDYADERLGVDDLELARELAAGLSASSTCATSSSGSAWRHCSDPQTD